MTFDEVRRSLDEYDAINRAKKAEEIEATCEEENASLRVENKQLIDENRALTQQNEHLQLKVDELTWQGSDARVNQLVRKGVFEEIRGYPYHCSEDTRYAINRLVDNKSWSRFANTVTLFTDTLVEKWSKEDNHN